MVIRVLHCVSSLGGGGVARVLLNYLGVQNDRDIRHDFVVHGDAIGELESQFEDLGCNIVHAPPKKRSLIANARVIETAISSKRYNVVHAHQNFSNVLPLTIARAQGVPVRISHGHGFPSLHPMAAWVARRGILSAATHLMACSDDVGKWVHGPGWGKAYYEPFVMTNAIDTLGFLSRVGNREMTRRDLGFEGHKVLLQIGRLSREKNHEFSLDLMELLSSDPEWKLAIVGSGPLLQELRVSARRRGIEDCVIFTGFRDDIPSIMNAADIMLLPSHSEGFPMVTTEAQTLGLPVVVSPAVTCDAAITNQFEQVPLVADWWEDAVVHSVGKREGNRRSEVIAKGFDVRDASVRYVDYLQRAVARRTPVRDR